MGWFVGRGYSVHAWNQPWSGTIATDYMHPDLYIDLVRALERACFDYVMIEDGSFVPDGYKGSPDWYLNNAFAVPKHDPIPLAAMIAAGTSRMGVVATMSTMAWPPFMLARVSTTLDHIAGGRFGWNIVTSGEDAAAQNFGMHELPPREKRYAMADEYVELVCRLWDSWEPDAVIKDRERGLYAVHMTRPDNERSSQPEGHNHQQCK